MSSAPGRIRRILGPTLRGIAWTVLFAVLAASGAGIVHGTWHAPGSAARAELTWVGDAALGQRLDVAATELQRISDDVKQLADDAKTALAEVASTDQARLTAALDDGARVAGTIASATLDLRTALAGLPGDEPNAVIEYGNATLVRRAAILAAVDAASSLASDWTQVKARAADAAHLTALIATHDQTVLAAAAKGVKAEYADAAATLDGAILTVADIKALRVRLIAGTDRTVLDEWVDRNRAYDVALKALYLALVASKGDVTTLSVQAARHDERAAFDKLPPDRRTILVIVAEVARGGLTQGVLAIDEARSRIDTALAEVDPS